jgi:hypothetical protein
VSIDHFRIKVYNFNVPTFGPGVVYDVEQKVRTEQFRFFTEALKKDRLKKYVPQFVKEAEVGMHVHRHGLHAWQHGHFRDHFISLCALIYHIGLLLQVGPNRSH